MSKLTRLEQELRAGRLSRRDFLQAATALGFGAVAPAILTRPAFAAPKQGGKLELYDLSADLGEADDVATKNPEVLKKFEQYLKGARTESAAWPTN